MNIRQINEVRMGASAKLRELHAQNKTDNGDSLVLMVDKQDSIPRSLFLDESISAGAVRAYGVLVSHSPTIFPGIRSLGKVLGGSDGAVRTTDELFLSRWATKEVVRDEQGKQALGTIYVLFPNKKTCEEMVAIDAGWQEFIVRLARPSTAKTDKKAALRRRARAIIEANQELFRGVFPISDSAISDSENATQSFIQEEGSSKKKILSKETHGQPAAGRLSFENELGFCWSSSWDRFLGESRAVSIMKKHKLTDTTQARRVMGEWANSAFKLDAEGGLDDAAGLLISLIKKADGQLAHTSGGDQWMPKFG